MSKRSFRPTTQDPAPAADYPTFDQYDGSSSRRSFLARLGAIGAALVGGAALAACGDRTVATTPDAGPRPDGIPGDDLHQLGGVAPMPDGREPAPDAGPPSPDGQILAGEPPMPDARIDEPDGLSIGGVAPAPDAQIDGNH
jgi:hypothetical protein